jgi:hypothetical protein
MRFSRYTEGSLKADLARHADYFFIAFQIGVGAGNQWQAGLQNQVPGGRLGTHQFHGLGRGANKDNAGVTAGAREIGVLGQKAVAGMDGFSARALGGVNQSVDAQVAVDGGRRTDGERFVGVAHVERLAVHL